MLHARMGRRRITTIVVAAGLLIGAGAVGTRVRAGASTAAGTEHVIVQKFLSNGSAAVEGSVKLHFTCDSASGAWALDIKDVSVIAQDHVTRWPTLAIEWHLVDPSGDHRDGTTVALKQNTTSGLFRGADGGTLSDPSACRHNSTLFVQAAGDTTFMLFIQVPLR